MVRSDSQPVGLFGRFREPTCTVVRADLGVVQRVPCHNPIEVVINVQFTAQPLDALDAVPDGTRHEHRGAIVARIARPPNLDAGTRREWVGNAALIGWGRR